MRRTSRSRRTKSPPRPDAEPVAAGRRLGALVPVLLAAMTIGVIVLAWSSAAGDSATFDEPAHIASGLLKVREGEISFYREQGPLMDAVVALPLAAAGYRVPPEWRSGPAHPWVIGDMLVHRSGYDAQALLLRARLPVIALLVALCFTVYFFVLRAAGDQLAALAAFALTGFCPNLLAHGHLATVDLGVTFFLFAAVALFVRTVRSPSMIAAAGCGVATAFAITSKASAAIVVVFFALMMLRRDRPWRHLAAAALSSLATFMAVYLLLARSVDPLLPFREWLGTVAAVRRLYGTGFPLPQFLLGEFSTEGWAHYQLVAIGLKTTLPALGLSAFALVAALRRPRPEAVACLLFGAVFLAAAAFSRLSIGLRHVLPVFPFLYAAAGIALAEGLRNGRRALFAGALVAWHVVAGVAAWPATISYFNPLIGSHRNADRLLIDSNLDWGQDLRRLGSWARQNGVERIHVDYFGAGDVPYDTGGRGIAFSPSDGRALPPGWLALSRHAYRISFAPGSAIDYDTLLRRARARYAATVGGSIDIYRLE